MTWIALILFGLAIASWRHSHYCIDDVNKFLVLSGALIGLMAGLAIAPLPLKALSLTALLLYPLQAPGDRAVKSDYPGFWLLRHQYKPPSKSNLF